MVLLTMTPLLVEALQKRSAEPCPDVRDTKDAPSLKSPAAGNPISHAQVVDLWRDLRELDAKYSLENLLKSSRVYIAPPPPKPEPSAEYKALMARLRREEEERKYERMVSSTKTNSFAQQFPTSTNSVVHSFAEVNRPSTKDDLGDDDVTFNDVHRQVMLLLNFMVTIIGCAATLWILARWWSTPARLFLTMGGSIVVAIAEVGLYYGYVWHLGEAQKKEVKVKEVRQVLETWVVNKEDQSATKKLDLGGRGSDGTAVRQRKVDKKEKEST